MFQDAFTGTVTLREFGTENKRTAMITEGALAAVTEVSFISSTQADVIAFLSAAGRNPGYGRGVTRSVDDVPLDSRVPHPVGEVVGCSKRANAGSRSQ